MESYRISAEAGLYFVTFTIVEWLPVFISDAAFQIVTNSLNFCHQSKFLRINAYVIMPNHMHAIVFDAEGKTERLKAALTDFRKFTGRKLIEYTSQHLPACYWKVFEEEAPSDRERRFWQPSRHPEAITTERFWKQKMDYLHVNPCRKGFVRRAIDWRYSSASTLVGNSTIPNDVILSPVMW